MHPPFSPYFILFLFLMQFRLRRAMAFVSCPIHLLYVCVLAIYLSHFTFTFVLRSLLSDKRNASMRFVGCIVCFYLLTYLLTYLPHTTVTCVNAITYYAPASRERSRSLGPLMLTHIAHHIFRTTKAYEVQTWYSDGGRRPASATGAVTSKVKGQGRKVT